MDQETELIHRCRCGDDAAWNTLIGYVSGAIWGTIRQRGFSLPQDLREDVFQDVCVQIHASLPRFRGECSLRYYAARIAVNACINYYRKYRKDRGNLSLDEPGSESSIPLRDRIPSPDGDPSQQVLARADQADLDAAMNRLSVRERALLVGHFIEGLSYEEISNGLNITPKHAAVITFRAIHKIRRVLAEK